MDWNKDALTQFYTEQVQQVLIRTPFLVFHEVDQLIWSIKASYTHTTKKGYEIATGTSNLDKPPEIWESCW